MTRILARALIAAALPASAVAADCEPVAALSSPSAEAAARDLLAPDEATCLTAREASGEAFVCFTAHPFRAEAARAAYDALAARIAACLPGGAVADAAVNHPDSYDALAWEAPGARISLSLKDKGGEGRTLIFLRVAPTP
ncbi:MAG: hypothetical protein AAFN79_09860 [Pseudomonadota bacterium]